MKNEHIVWAYGSLDADPSKVVVLAGLTDTGLKYLAENPGMTLTIDPPGGVFAKVTKIIVYAEKDKATLKATLARGGVQVSEAN